ncbi:unnamed protein product [Paramecium sonneborni]|uniref:Uncharacterized protein n=1 Tax=Paramecium sonneborni TaxID=65129 RepID=A0A8S1RB86_9CILI|nr:unnamed protein product [Paramecium sonneborni]
MQGAISLKYQQLYFFPQKQSKSSNKVNDVQSQTQIFSKLQLNAMKDLFLNLKQENVLKRNHLKKIVQDHILILKMKKFALYLQLLISVLLLKSQIVKISFLNVNNVLKPFNQIFSL